MHLTDHQYLLDEFNEGKIKQYSADFASHYAVNRFKDLEEIKQLFGEAYILDLNKPCYVKLGSYYPQSELYKYKFATVVASRKVEQK